MKRRSARPFTVEVKNTRTSRVSPVDTAPRARSSQDIWWDIPGVTVDKPAPEPFAAAAPAEPAPIEAPARRVLPSLVPMFSTDGEPEAADEPAPIERLPRVRRVKPATERAPKPVAKAKAKPVSPAAPQPAPAPMVAAALSQPGAIPGLGRAIRLARQGDTLKAGERWKRRLPRHLW